MIAADGPLLQSGREVSGAFDLLGWNANNLTEALAFTLARSPLLLGLLVERLLPCVHAASATLRLETRDDLGRTPEIGRRSGLLVVEAKRRWVILGRRSEAAMRRGSGPGAAVPW